MRCRNPDTSCRDRKELLRIAHACHEDETSAILDIVKPWQESLRGGLCGKESVPGKTP